MQTPSSSPIRTNEKNPNRETWLLAASRALAPWFEAEGMPLPPHRIACGFPSTRALSTKGRRIGECWSDMVSSDGVAELLISPVLDDPQEVAATLVHELIHAAIGCDHGHDPTFAAAARRMLLEGKPTATVASDAFRERVAPILAELGPYPHAKLIPGGAGRKKQGTRLRKAWCATEECGYTVRVTAKWLEIGPPHCPLHGAMEVEPGEEMEETEGE